MKILHICLGSFYIDNYSYQENMLPKFHKKMGYEVEILTNLVTFDENGKACFLKNGSKYVNEFGIPVTRLNFKKPFLKITRILKICTGTYEAVEKSNPDIIFIHGCQFYDIKFVVKYIKKNHYVKVYVDNHADFSNSATNWISKNILHKIIWRKCAQIIEPFTVKFYGVLPARVDFLVNMYKLPKQKVDLLVMGADDEIVNAVNDISISVKIRKRHGIENDDFLIISGGKIDHNKLQVLNLMQAVENLNLPKIKLLIFGSVLVDIQEIFKSHLYKSIQYIGWLKPIEIYEYFSCADLIVFPGLHSVLWEQAVGMGKPCIFKYINGFTHIDLGGNCEYIYNDSYIEIEKLIQKISADKDLYNTMKTVALEKGMEMFSYKKIAQRSISHLSEEYNG